MEEMFEKMPVVTCGAMPVAVSLVQNTWTRWHGQPVSAGEAAATSCLHKSLKQARRPDSLTKAQAVCGPERRNSPPGRELIAVHAQSMTRGISLPGSHRQKRPPASVCSPMHQGLSPWSKAHGR